MNKKLLLLGGGGHCKSVLGSVMQRGEYNEIGIVDIARHVGKTILGVSVIGCDEDLPDLKQAGFIHAFITLGSIGNPQARIKLFSYIQALGFEIPNIIDRAAAVSEDACLGSGIFVGKHAVINAGTNIGNGAIINTSSTIEHDCVIGDFVHLASGAVLCGEVHVGTNTHIGANSTVRQQIRIGSGSLIGMGSVVLRDVSDHVLAYGNPCKEIKMR